MEEHNILAVGIYGIPIIRQGNSFFFVFSDRSINVDRVLQVVPVSSSAVGIQVKQFTVFTIDFSSLNAIVVSI